jgi:hypothetical protein
VVDQRRLEPVPDWLMREVPDPVLSDLQRPRPVEFELGVERRADRSVLWLQERGVRGAAGLTIPERSMPLPELWVAFADWLQEQVGRIGEPSRAR